jgi:tetratricopeptide (TPR) repeat protein
MATRPTCPHAGRLEVLLRGSSPPDDEAALIAHLNSCHRCRASIDEQFSGDAFLDGLRPNLDRADPRSETELRRVLSALRRPEPGSLPSDSNEAGSGSMDSSDATPGTVDADGTDVPPSTAETRPDSDATTPRPSRPEDGLTPVERSFLDPSHDPQSLGRLGPYEVLGLVGRGGMGIVMKAFDPALKRIVAVKALSPALAFDAVARRRFIREAQAAAAVCHDHVVNIHAVDASGRLPFLVMQYIPGPSLQQKLDRDGPLGVKEVLRIGMQVASGLAAAHAQGLIHRDIKPSNILLEDSVERVKITDFGLARIIDDASLSDLGTVAGTPSYMSPEQARGETVDRRSDLFSLGSLFYAMCTGRAPFRAESALAILKKVNEEEPRPIRSRNPDVPDWLVAIIAKLMAKQPDDRYRSASEVAELMGLHLAQLQDPGSPGPGRSPGHPGMPSSRRPGYGIRRRRAVLAATAAGIILLAALALLTLRSLGRRPSHHSETRRDGHSGTAGVNAPKQRVVRTADSPSTLLNLGKARAALATGDFDKSIDRYDVVLRFDPAHVDAYVGRSRAYLGKGDLDSSLADVNRAIELDPDSAEAHLGRGWIYHRKKDHAGAIAEYTRAIELGIDRGIIGIDRGLAHASLKNWDVAIADYSEVARVRPQDAWAFANRAVAHATLKHWDEAIADYSEVIRLRPNDLWAFVSRAAAWRAKKEYARALPDFTEAIRLAPRSAPYYYDRGWIHNELRQWDQAVEDFGRAIQLDVNNPWCYQSRAWTNRARLRPKDALADHDTAIRLDPQTAAFVRERGVTYLDLDELDRAIVDFDRALELDPNHCAAMHNLGRAYRAKGNFGRAISYLSQAIRLEREKASHYLERGVAYKEAKEWDRAIADFDMAHKLDPAQHWGLFNKLIAYREKGDLETSLRFADEAVRLYPDDPMSFGQRAITQRSRRKWAEAIADLEQARDLKPNDAQTRIFVALNLAIVERERKNLPRALALCEEAVKVDPANFWSYVERQATYRVLKDWDKAVEDATKCIELKPNSHLGYEYRGWDYGQMGKHELAIADYNRAIGLYSGAAYLFNERSWRYQALEQWDKSLADLDKSLQLDPRQPGIYEVRANLRARLGDAKRAEQDRQEAARLRSQPAKAAAR